MKEIILTSGAVALVDDEDYPILSKMTWCERVIGNTSYAIKHISDERQKYVILMHRLVMGFPKSSYCVDHKNRNGLDNRKENLRIATTSQNCFNARRITTYGGMPVQAEYKGIQGYDTKTLGRRYNAKLVINGKCHYAGTHGSAEDAARAYDKIAVQVCGEFAVLNFPDT